MPIPLKPPSSPMLIHLANPLSSMRNANVLDEQLLDVELFTLEDDLQNAVEADTSTMKSFLERLSDLQSVITRGIANNTMNANTLSLVRSIASNGVILADHYLNVNRAYAAVEQRRNMQLHDAFSRLSLKESNTSSRSTDRAKPSLQRGRFPTSSHPSLATRSSSSLSSDSDSDIIPPHIPHAYEWLLKNIHDPYPPSSVKTRLATETGTSAKTISEWFVKIRRRIGWTKISKQFFKGKRAVTVDHARAVFFGESRTADVTGLIRDSFNAMKNTAETIFDGKLETSEVAKQLDSLVRTVSTNPQSQLQQLFKRRIPQSGKDRDASNVSRTGEANCDSIKRATNLKRHSYLDDEPDESVSTRYSAISIRPLKRSRSSSSSSEFNTSSSRQSSIGPTTPSSDTLTLDCGEKWCQANGSTPHQVDPLPISRKRCYSNSEAEEDCAPVHKRFCASSYPESFCQPQLFASLSDSPPDTRTQLWTNANADLSNIWPAFDFTLPTEASVRDDLLQGDLDLSIYDISSIPSLTAPTDFNIEDLFDVQSQCPVSNDDLDQLLELLGSSGTPNTDYNGLQLSGLTAGKLNNGIERSNEQLYGTIKPISKAVEQPEDDTLQSSLPLLPSQNNQPFTSISYDCANPSMTDNWVSEVDSGFYSQLTSACESNSEIPGSDPYVANLLDF